MYSFLEKMSIVIKSNW